MIEVKNGILRIVEDTGGSRGSNYVYVDVNGGLVPIKSVFNGRTVGVSRGGRRKTYEYVIPLTTIKNKFGDKIWLYEFRFSNSGYGPYCRMYEIDSNTGSISKKQLTNVHLNFKILGDEGKWLNRYDEVVPGMIDKVKQIQQMLGIDLFFAEKSVRLEDIYSDPQNAKKIALVFPKPQARSRALQTYIQSAHELYVLMLVGCALNGKTVYHVYDNKPTWWIAHAQDYPTAVVEVNNRKFTIWYQFSIDDWLKVVAEGIKRTFFGERSLLKRQNVKPDIVIFEGDYRWKEDLERNPPHNVIVIDAKIEIKDSDVKQLRGYKEIFGPKFEKIHYMVTCLEGARYKQILQKLGYIVIENVSPNEVGERKFINIIKDFIK